MEPPAGVRETETVYVLLPDEAIDAWRPVEAERIGGEFRLRGPAPEGERWEFGPGTIVRCVKKRLSGGEYLVAIEAVSSLG